MDISNAYGTPLALAGVVFGALSFLFLIALAFKGNVHF